MLPYIIRRLAISVVVLLVSTFMVFYLVAKSGNPLSTLSTRQPPPPRATILALRHQLHLDSSIPVRYWYWLRDAVQGNFGHDLGGASVTSELGSRLGVTTRLIFAAVVLALILALVTGVLSAVKQYSVMDYASTFVSFLLISIPTFWFAGVLKDIGIRINQGAGSRIFSVSGEVTPDYHGGFFGGLSDRLSHLILPTISLAMLTYAIWSRYLRATMLDVLNADYMRLARAKGVRWGRVLVRHGLRTALIPFTTVVAVTFSALVGGTVITETIFDWHGMGEWLLQSLGKTDINPVLAYLFITAIAVVVFNLVADILYAVLDPRIRLA